jgi:hypothetical protein
MAGGPSPRPSPSQGEGIAGPQVSTPGHMLKILKSLNFPRGHLTGRGRP